MEHIITLKIVLINFLCSIVLSFAYNNLDWICNDRVKTIVRTFLSFMMGVCLVLSILIMLVILHEILNR